MNFKRYKCPKCGGMTGLKIVYGYPGPELSAASERGEVALGGCCIAVNLKNPTRKCTACGHEWGVLKCGRGPGSD